MPKRQRSNIDIQKEIVRDKIDVIDLLEYYNVDIPQKSINYDYIRIPCPIHLGDNPTAFSFGIHSKNFSCFSQGCGDDVGHDVFSFIILMEEKMAEEEGLGNFKCGFYRALEIAGKIAGVQIDPNKSVDKNTIDQLDNKRWMREMNSVSREDIQEVYDEDDIVIYQAQLPVAEDYLSGRDITEDMIDFFEIGYSPQGVDEDNLYNFPGRLVFPVRDKGGNLVGWSGRILTSDKKKEKAFRKWKHKADFDKGLSLYNFYYAQEHIKETREVIIVEGIFDVMRLWSYGLQNVIAVLGASLTPQQLSLVVSKAFKMYVWLDPDQAGRDASERICKQLKPYGDVYEVSSPKDPDDLTADQAYECLDNARKFI